MGAYFFIFCAGDIVVPGLPAKQSKDGSKKTFYYYFDPVCYIWSNHGNYTTLSYSVSLFWLRRYDCWCHWISCRLFGKCPPLYKKISAWWWRSLNRKNNLNIQISLLINYQITPEGSIRSFKDSFSYLVFDLSERDTMYERFILLDLRLVNN